MEAAAEVVNWYFILDLINGIMVMMIGEDKFMKKIFIFVLMLLMIAPISVKADDHIYSIDVNVYVEKSGSAYITEVWDVQADGGTEWCKLLSNLENAEVSDYYVLMDEKEMESMEWKSGGSVKDKAGRYGINYITGGVELCFGKSDNERHRFMFAYSLSDYVITTDDSQVIYHVLTPKATVDTFFADIITYYSLPDDLEVWGYGYEGNSYVSNGRIVISNYDGMSEQYATVLARFPLETFESTKTIKKFDKFDDVYKDAETGGYKYDASVGKNFRFTFIDFVFVLLSLFVVFLIIEFIFRKKTGKSILKQEKVEKVLDKIVPVFKKIFGKVKEFILKIIKMIKNKLGKKKDNNM